MEFACSGIVANHFAPQRDKGGAFDDTPSKLCQKKRSVNINTGIGVTKHSNIEYRPVRCEAMACFSIKLRNQIRRDSFEVIHRQRQNAISVHRKFKRPVYDTT